MQTIFGYALQELRRVFTTPSRLLLWLAPLVAFALCMWVYSGRVLRDLPVAVIDFDQSAFSRTLTRDLDATPQLKLVPMVDEAQVKEAFRRGKVRAAIMIPAGSDQEVRQGRTAHLVLWRDASNPIAANQAYSASAMVASTEMARLEVSRLMLAGVPYNQAKELALILRADNRPLGNPFLDYLRNMAPGLLAMFLQMAMMLAAGNLLPNRWPNSSSPRRELFGRSLPWFILYGATAAVLYAIVFPAWGIPSPPLPQLLSLLALLMIASISFGALIGKLIPTQVQTAQILLAFNTPAFVLSGYSFPEWAMPPVVEWLTRPLPFSFFMDAYRAANGDLLTRESTSWLGIALYALIPAMLVLLPKRTEKVKAEAKPIPNEFSRIVREAGLPLLVLVAPFSYLLLYGSVYVVKEEQKLPIAVTGDWSSATTRTLVRNLDAHPRLYAEFMDEKSAEQAVRKGDVRAALYLPMDLDLRLHQRLAVQAPLEIPATRFLPVSDIQRAVTEVFSSQAKEMRALIFMSRGVPPSQAEQRAEPLLLEDHPMYNPCETYGDFMLPGLGALIMHQLLLVSIAFATGSCVFRAKKKKDLGNLVIRGAILASWFSLWTMLWFTFGLPFFHVPGHMHLGLMLALTLPALFATAALGMSLGMILGSGQSVLQLLAFSSYPFFFVSGMSWPREAFSPVLDAIGNLIPLRPLVAGLQRIFRADADFSDIRPELVHVFILLIGYLSLAVLARTLLLRRNSKLAE